MTLPLLRTLQNTERNPYYPTIRNTEIEKAAEVIVQMSGEYPPIGLIEKTVLDVMKVNPYKFRRELKCRLTEYREARQMIFLFSRLLTPTSSAGIGVRYRKDHATVLHGSKVMVQDIDRIPRLKTLFNCVCVEMTKQGYVVPEDWRGKVKTKEYPTLKKCS